LDGPFHDLSERSPCTIEQILGDEDVAALDAADDAADTFLPDEHYATKENDLAPGQSSPYSTYERFSPNGDLKQVTTYDEYGVRAYQRRFTSWRSFALLRIFRTKSATGARWWPSW
jgi:hypothetical protein